MAIMSDRNKRRMDIARAVKFSRRQRDEIERVLEWLLDFPEEAAAYIVWGEDYGDESKQGR